MAKSYRPKRTSVSHKLVALAIVFVLPLPHPAPAAAESPGPRPQAAALSVTREALPRFAMGATKALRTPGAVEQFAQADALWRTSDLPRAINAYLSVMEAFPDTVQAKASSVRMDYIVTRVTPEEADAIAAELPPMETLKSVAALTSASSFYFLRAQAEAGTDPERAAAYYALVCDHGWRIFAEKLDDEYKSTVLEAYLASADAIGRGEELRAKLSAHANDIAPSFTAWLIKSVVDGAEPPAEFVPTAEGRTAIKKYWVAQARDSSNPDEYHALCVKTRDVAWQLLVEQPRDVPVFAHARDFLRASQGMGEAEYAAAISRVEEWLKTEPLSIMRWIARYELADHTGRGRSSEEQARAVFQHFETLVTEAGSGLIDVAINDTRFDVNVRGLLLLTLGHGYWGTNKVEDAELCYNLVLENFPVETHAGESAAYALVEVAWRKDYPDTALTTASFKRFAAEHPDCYYAPLALIRAGEEYARAGDMAHAEQMYQQVIQEYPTRSFAKSARNHLAAIRAVTQFAE